MRKQKRRFSNKRARYRYFLVDIKFYSASGKSKTETIDIHRGLISFPRSHPVKTVEHLRRCVEKELGNSIIELNIERLDTVYEVENEKTTS